MELVLTLVTGPDCPAIDPGLVQDVRTAMEALGAETATPEWLSQDFALDVHFSRLSPDQAEAAAEKVLEGHPIDINAQAVEGRQKRLLIADMDSTMVTSETLDDLADCMGLKKKVAAITARAMNGEIDFNDALRERVALLKGLKEIELQNTYKKVQLTPGARELVATMRRNGAYTMLVSGGFSFFTEKVARRLKFHRQSGNVLDIKRGKLTGKVIEPIINRDSKLQALMSLAAEKQVALPETLAVGDGANDLPMIMAAGLGVAYHAKPVVAAEARFQLNHANLRGLLYLQGYSDSIIDK